MGRILVTFWLQRFALVFVIACAGLSVVELSQQSAQAFSYRSVLGWSALAALITASVSAYWAYKRQCRLVFKNGDTT
ncbi:MAG TPA: hypothetical protein VIT67_16090 [Povalibacter sp.]